MVVSTGSQEVDALQNVGTGKSWGNTSAVVFTSAFVGARELLSARVFLARTRRALMLNAVMITIVSMTDYL